MSRFIDDVDIILRSGKGGPGAVSFRHERYVPKGGPDGGDGGRGGDVIIEVRRNLKTLYHLKLKNRIHAQNGTPGRGKNQHGADGRDSIVYVPPGTVVLDRATGRTLADLTREGESLVAVRGGRGGRGNARFATATNQTPRFAQPGEPGAEALLNLQIKVIADIGMVGLPNVGKSTLLSVLTNAKPKIGDYPFTTLTPNLGVMEYGAGLEYVIADIPGLIRGASAGHGLGIRFLKHIERTRVLMLLLDMAEGNIEVDCRTLLGEMGEYSEGLLRKPRLLVGTKLDVADAGRVDAFRCAPLEGTKIPISSITRLGIEDLKKQIVHIMENAHGS
jgi:GTP-binding protein